MTNPIFHGLLLPTLLIAGVACTPARAAVPEVGAVDPVVVGAPADRSPVAAHSPRTLAAADTGSLVLSGNATVRVPADRARIRIAVETEASTASAAADANAALANEVIEAVRAVLGTLSPEERLETEGFDLRPRYARDELNREDPRIIGYTAVNAVLVVLDDIDETSAVLDAAIDAGANRIDQLGFFASDLTEARHEAIRQAVEQARGDAETTAAALGLVLGPILEVRTDASSQGERSEMMLMSMDQARSTPIEGGSQGVTVNVMVTWSLPGGAPR